MIHNFLLVALKPSYKLEFKKILHQFITLFQNHWSKKLLNMMK